MRGNFMRIDRSAEHLVLDRLQPLARLERAEEGRRGHVDQLAVLECMRHLVLGELLLVVVADFRRHARLHHEWRILLAVLG